MNAPPLLFWSQYLRRPLGIGAIAPSSRSLARAMVKALAVEAGDVVVELGPGTGVFTRRLLEEGVACERLILVEFNPDFARWLRKTFKGVTVIEGDAGQLPAILAPIGHAQVPRILSGLPLRSMTPSVRGEIARAISHSLAPGGTLVQFTYFNGPPLPKAASVELEVHRAGVVLGNIPPAFIWRYVKQAAHLGSGSV
jgi:phosphatidylethanolamine/phosphatidyl-N-methylethanolamine N-methyltransferase